MAGSARTAVRSRACRRRIRVSWGPDSTTGASVLVESRCRSGGSRRCALMKFTQELIRRDEERIHVEQAPNKHHRMRAQDIHGDPSVNLGGVVDADDHISVLDRDVVETGLVLHHVVDRPGYVPDKTGER